MRFRAFLLLTALAVFVSPFLPVAPGAGAADLPVPHGWDSSRYIRTSELRAGMTGVGRTVFSGTRIEEFQVEILGVLQTASPRGDIVLARITGKGLEKSGVVAGMSGSPVFVDGRLLGAVAYGWSFSREPIAGITPIEEMLRVEERSGGALFGAGGEGEKTGWSCDPDLWDALWKARGREVFDLLVPRAVPPPGDLTPLAIPVSISGLGQEGTALVSRVLEGAGMIPVEGGATGKTQDDSLPPLEPGSAVGVELVRGDARIAAVGTVTWTEGNRILAFGHPMMNRGPTAYPMTPAKILAVLPRLSQSFKLGAVGKPVGAVIRDYSSGIMGRVGESPRMVPLELELEHESRREHLHFEILEAPGLTPALAGVVAANSAGSLEHGQGPATLRMRTRVTLADGRRVERRAMSAGFSPPVQLGAEVARLVGLLDGNPFEPVRISRIEVQVSVENAVRATYLDQVAIQPGRYHPGSQLAATVVLRDYRGGTQNHEMAVRLPRDIPPGQYVLRVCGGSEDRHREEARAPGRYKPVNLEQLFRELSHEASDDMLVLKILDGERNPIVRGREFPSLPRSLKTVLLNPLSAGRVTATAGGVRLVRRQPMGRVVLGCKSVPLTVKPSS